MNGTSTLDDARNVFLTGATGFLGAFLLHELLSTTEATVHCLVRPRGDAAPMAGDRDEPAPLRDLALTGGPNG